MAMVSNLCGGKVAYWGGTTLGRTETSGLWCGFPPNPLNPNPPALKPLLSIGLSPDFQDIFHGAKDSLKTKKYKIQVKLIFLKAFKES